jgi:hypothetical protein
MRAWRARLSGAALAVLLAACAFVNPTQIAPGTPRAEVLQALGQPTARYPLPDGGERLQYSRQPAGQAVFNVDLDAQGRLRRAEQVLNESLFAERIRPDVWTRADVLREYGPPARVIGVHNFKGDIGVWRYADGPVWRLLYIDIDPTGVVRRWSNGDENLPDDAMEAP